MNNWFKIIDQYQFYHFSLQKIEKILSKYIIEYTEENELFYKNQFGFRKQHSTSHAIITLVEKVSKVLDKGKIVVGVFLDVKKYSTQLITQYYQENYNYTEYVEMYIIS